MVNPIKLVRKREGLTQSAFAKRVGVHPQAVLLNEAGCYPEILPAISKWLRENGYNIIELQAQYKAFVIKKRQDFGDIVPVSELAWDLFDLNEHPIVVFRRKLGFSRMGLAKALAIQPAFLYKLENGEAISLSSQFKEALLGAGFSPGFIEELNERCSDFANFSESHLTKAL